MLKRGSRYRGSVAKDEVRPAGKAISVWASSHLRLHTQLVIICSYMHSMSHLYLYDVLHLAKAGQGCSHITLAFMLVMMPI